MTADPDRIECLRMLRRNAVASALLIGIAVFGTIAAAIDAGALLVAEAALLYAAGCALLFAHLDSHLPQRRFGPANQVTLLRFALACVLAACAGRPFGNWLVVVIATLAALLDAVDGWLARRLHIAGAFGARFDMETDAILILVLSALAWTFDRAGPWVLASGLMRYAFVAAGWCWTWLARPVPDSLRRKTVCVVQIVTLIVCLGPVISPSWAATSAAAGMALLSYSFGADIVWLIRRRHDPRPVSRCTARPITHDAAATGRARRSAVERATLGTGTGVGQPCTDV